MARKYLVAVPKGGCGKTTTVHNLGMAFAEQGRRVLFVDTDPQGNLSSILGFAHTSGAPTLYTALREFTMNRKDVLPSTIYHVQEGVDLVPANMLLNRANDELASQMKREYILKRLLESVEEHYDAILIDTLPYLGVLVNNALERCSQRLSCVIVYT